MDALLRLEAKLETEPCLPQVMGSLLPALEVR